jgi:hypothetical protein
VIGKYDNGRKIRTELGIEQKARRIVTRFVPYAEKLEGDIMIHITGDNCRN